MDHFFSEEELATSVAFGTRKVPQNKSIQNPVIISSIQGKTLLKAYTVKPVNKWRRILKAGSCQSHERHVPLITAILKPLLSGLGEPSLSPDELFLLSSPVLDGHFVKVNHSNTVEKSVPGN